MLARSLDALKQWFASSKENFDKTLGKEFKVEFPFKQFIVIFRGWFRPS
jgi:hypothetical protein